jgi:prepilin-type N-terminal cleavage/methylation domain-containing protein
MNRSDLRRAFTLVELLASLAIGGIVLTLFVRAIVGHGRAERRIAVAQTATNTTDEAVHVLVGALSRLSAVDTFWTRGDTAIELRSTIGVSVACAANADSIIVPDTGPGAWWEVFADSADAAEISNASGVWSRYEVRAAQARVSGPPCGTAQRVIRLRNAALTPDRPLVRVTRRTRYMLYRASDSQWWLGQRICTDGATVQCGAAQPAAGPLAAAPSGLRFDVSSPYGRPVIAITARRGAAERSIVSAPAQD